MAFSELIFPGKGESPEVSSGSFSARLKSLLKSQFRSRVSDCRG